MNLKKKDAKAKKPFNKSCQKSQTVAYFKNGSQTFRVNIGHDNAPLRWLAAKRQQLEQEYSRLRHQVESSIDRAAAAMDESEAIDMEGVFGKENEIHMTVPMDGYHFMCAAVAMQQCARQLRSLGIEPDRSGMTPEAFAWFLEELAEEDAGADT